MVYNSGFFIGDTMEYTVNLDEGFGQCGDQIGYQTSIFPGGEIWIELDVPFGVKSVRLNSRCNNSNDFMRIIMTIDALRRRGVDKIELFIPYFPYSRQDRVCSPGEAFSVKVICEMLKNLNLYNIITYDIHSGVPAVLLDNLQNYQNHREVLDFIEYLKLPNPNYVLVCPDAGAVKRTQAIFTAFPNMFESIIYCHKERVDGRVNVKEIYNNIAGMTAFVVDDICDGGATFEAIGKRLQERHVKESYLFVSHGIFSKSTYELAKYYKKIGTTNSIHDDEYIEELPAVKSFRLDY
jgi:ribose-phosphate pyrophosphokinase